MTPEPLIVSFDNVDTAHVDKWGAKGAKLAEDFQRVREDFPDLKDVISVPDGFILSTDVWRHYHAAGNVVTDNLFDRIMRELAELERREGRRFGDISGRMPLIVAVRGGAPISLPGALATLLNVGLNDDVVSALVAAGKDERFVLTTYLTGIRMYGEVVLGIPYQHFYEIIKRDHIGVEGTLSVPQLLKLIDEFKAVLEKTRHPRFPSRFEADLPGQLRNAIESILSSWMSPTAIEARSSRSPKVPDDMGTAVIIQTMVFGNKNDRDCLSGVMFTRNQRTGANYMVIDWAPKVQCDKIVSGKIRKPLRNARELKEQFPDIYGYLEVVRDRAESRSKRPLDIEFTVESRRLFIVQRRALRMTFSATVRAMWDLVDAGKTTIQLASLIINNALEQPEKVVREGFRDFEILAVGEPITNSADSGILTFGTESALEVAARGEDVILLRRRPYGETDLAVNHPRIRGIIRCDGNTTGHEAVSAVAYSKPYIISAVDAEGQSLVLSRNEHVILNPESPICQYIGKRVFIDGERGILGYTEAQDFLEDRKGQKKLYLDWEYLREQFEAAGYHRLDYEALLDIHYQWELELEHYQRLEKRLREDDPTVSREVLLQAFSTYLSYIPKRDRERTLRLKDVQVEDFKFEPPIVYHGKNLGKDVLKILRALMLATTWRTHWVHEIMVLRAKERGDTENDVIRDIFLKNRTMSLLTSFQKEGFHVMKAPNEYHLILASNFEYNQNLDLINIGPGTLDFEGKEILARRFLAYLQQINAPLAGKVRLVLGEPPLGQGHARIVSIGLSIPDENFDLVCRYLRIFLDRSPSGLTREIRDKIPANHFVQLYQLDPFFALHPDLKITRESTAGADDGDYLLAFGDCSFGEFDGVVYGHEGYEKLTSQVKALESFLRKQGKPVGFRPWHFEVDPYRRHSVIAAVGIRFPQEKLYETLDALKSFLAESG